MRNRSFDKTVAAYLRSLHDQQTNTKHAQLIKLLMNSLALTIVAVPFSGLNGDRYTFSIFFN